MIDIHSHLLPFVDDGSDSLTISLELLKQACEQGVTDMILTPHYGLSKTFKEEELIEKFNSFKEQVESNGIGINLYLGREIFIDRDYKKIFSQKNFATLNNSVYTLIEFDTDYECDVVNVVYELARIGIKPIIAHIERYRYIDLDMAYEIKQAGGLIQVNANEIVNNSFGFQKRFINRLFKNCLVDFVSSDIHSSRNYSMKKAYNKVLKKYGINAATVVFYDNAQKIIKGQS